MLLFSFKDLYFAFFNLILIFFRPFELEGETRLIRSHESNINPVSAADFWDDLSNQSDKSLEKFSPNLPGFGHSLEVIF